MMPSPILVQYLKKKSASVPRSALNNRNKFTLPIHTDANMIIIPAREVIKAPIIKFRGKLFIFKFELQN